MSNSVLVESMATWVSSLAKWRVFATHTFSYEASLWSARRVYERFMSSTLPGVSYFYAIEQNPSRDGFHVHAIWDSPEAPRKATHKEWLKRYGRNRIEPVRGFDDVVGYCAKYVCKDGAWWEFHLSRRVMGRIKGGMDLSGRADLFPSNAQAASRSEKEGVSREMGQSLTTGEVLSLAAQLFDAKPSR